VTTRSTRRRLAASAVAAVALVGAAAALGNAVGLTRAPADAATSAMVGVPAPELSGRTMTGATADLRTLRGRVVLVTVWASWCPPCRQELPVLAATRDRLGARGVSVLGILTRDQSAQARALLREVGAGQLTSVLDPAGALAVTWGATGVPETFVVDRAGTIRARRLGPVTAEWVRRYVDPLVA
jgi:cytochrome c biogenesis protein CcmG, thiol:disulfide interchange protein DsbE